MVRLRLKRISGAKFLLRDYVGYERYEDCKWLDEVSAEHISDEEMCSFLRGVTLVRISQKHAECDIVDLRMLWAPLAIECKVGSKRNYIYFDQIDEVRLGANTSGLRRTSVGGIPEKLIFSIMYSSSSGKYLELNVIMPTIRAAMAWTTWLSDMLSHGWRDRYLCILSAIASHNDPPPQTFFSPNIYSECSNLYDREFNANWASLIEILSARDEMVSIFASVSNGRPFISSEDFRRFMRVSQKNSHSDEYIDSLYTSYSSSGNGINLAFFTAFLLSSSNSISLEGRTPFDMHRPLSDYYINTSHNTYLVKSQVSMSSSLEGYIRALMKGCRCIEIDCHDGSNGSPVVYHKGTLGSRLLFSDVIQTIHKYAFVVSPYPLVLSLEIHCRERQRGEMAKILLRTLGSSLAFDVRGTNLKSLPSPESLKHKFLLRGKLSRCTTSESRRVGLSRESRGAHPKLQDLITHLQTISLRRNTIHENFHEYNRTFSLSEYDSIDLKRMCYDKYVSLNERFPVRVYPSAVRIMSSNFNPLPHLAAGCSMVAMNHQTKDKMMEIYSALFELNGGCGYVPKSIRSSNNIALAGIPISISLLSGHMLLVKTPSNLEIRVQIELIDTKRSIKQISDPVKFCGPVIYWNQRFSFTVRDCGLSFIRFKIFEVRNPMGTFSPASYTVCYRAISQGYRNVVLTSKNKRYVIPPTLFVYIEKIRPP